VRAHHVPWILAAALAAVAFPESAIAETGEEFDRRIITELRARDAAAADTFELANRAREAGNHQESAALFARVRERVPDNSHAWRREGYELLALDLKGSAIERMRMAMQLDPSAWNMLGLAYALSAVEEKAMPSEGEMNEAVSLIERAEKAAPDDPDIALLAAQLALMRDEPGWLGAEVKRLDKLAPENPWTHYFAAIHLAFGGDREGATLRLEKGRSLGLPEHLYRGFHDQFEHEGAPVGRLAAIGGWILGGWLAGFVALLCVGMLLSQATLGASQKVPKTIGGAAVGLDATIRMAYRWVLGACCAYYCVSIPIVLAAVLAIGGGLVYLMLRLGHIPVKLLLLVVVITVVTVWAVVKSLFIRSRDEDPGLKVGPGEHPRLRRVLDEVAGKIGTRSVTNVYLTPGTELAVMERGGIFKQVRGHTERCLILGIGAIDGMTLRPFRAILAHEYGHFSNQDTAGGGFALAIRRSLVTTAINLAQSGAAAWYNPAWLFVNGYYRVFLRISQGASRLQEVLADRWAAFVYGSRAFADGLRHVIDRSIRFDAHANSVLKEVIEGEKALANLYSYHPATALVDDAKLAASVEEAIHREPSPFDSHPRPADRIAWVEAIGSTGVPRDPTDGALVWTLFENREAVERRMTDEVRQNVEAAHGVEIGAEPRSAEREDPVV
jgi:Zn-dependent protease with chaperone function